jgi:hypothetical protein
VCNDNFTPYHPSSSGRERRRRRRRRSRETERKVVEKD